MIGAEFCRRMEKARTMHVVQRLQKLLRHPVSGEGGRSINARYTERGYARGSLSDSDIFLYPRHRLKRSTIQRRNKDRHRKLFRNHHLSRHWLKQRHLLFFGGQALTLLYRSYSGRRRLSFIASKTKKGNCMGAGVLAGHSFHRRRRRTCRSTERSGKQRPAENTRGRTKLIPRQLPIDRRDNGDVLKRIHDVKKIRKSELACGYLLRLPTHANVGGHWPRPIKRCVSVNGRHICPPRTPWLCGHRARR